MQTTDTRLHILRPSDTPRLLVKRRAWYDGDGDGEGNAAQTGNDPDKNGSSGGGGQQGIPQEEVNRLVGSARKQGRETALNDLLKELGFEKADDLKALVIDAKKRKDEELTEAQKAQAAREAAEKKLAEREAELEAERQAARVERRDNAIKKALAAAGAKNVDKLLPVLREFKASDVAAVLKEDGTVDDAKAKALADAAKKDYAEDFAAGGAGSGSHAGGKGGGKLDIENILGKRPFGSL